MRAENCEVPDCSGCAAGTCGVATPTSRKLKECNGCHSVRYCGRVCQKADWPSHKPECKRLQALRG